MNLQDEHLKQALKHAPDRDLVPSDVARTAVMAYANKALKNKKISWMGRISSGLHDWFGSSWHSVGLGSAVATLLIVVIVWHEQPDDTIWQVSKPIEESAYKTEDSVLESSPQVASVESRPEAAVVAAPMPAEVQSADKAETKGAVSASKAKSASPKVASNADQVTLQNKDLPEVLPQADAPVEMESKLAISTPSAPAPIAQEEAAVASRAKAELAKEDMTPKKSIARAESLGASLPKSVAMNGESLLARIKSEGGKAVANQDVQAGNFRLIKLEMQKKNAETLNCPQIQNQSIVADATTGFRVESVTVCETSGLLQGEVEIYNQTMRDWQSSNHSR